jgi:peptidoglycan/LPS O-acetylase OafA/YrhL
MAAVLSAVPREGLRTLPQHLASLDGLRGLAILMVLLHNMEILDVPTTWWAHAVELTFNVGWVGVQLFFVLSGFLITRILLQTQSEPGYYSSFFMRRVLRIFPLYYASLILFIFAVPMLTGTPTVGAQQQVWLWVYLVNWVEPFVPGQVPVPHFWSLAVEEQFYLIWPFVVARCSPRRVLQICLAIAVVALFTRVGMRLAGAPIEAVYMFTVCRMDALAMGAAAAALTQMPGVWAWITEFGAKRLLMVTAAVLLAGIPLTHGLYPRTDFLGQTLGYTILALAFTLLILAGAAFDCEAVSARPGLTLAWLRWAPLRTLGKYSYGIYIIHKPLHDLIGKPWLTSHGLLPNGSVLVNAGYLAFAIGVCVLLEMVIFHTFESRFLGLKRYFPATAH